MGIFYHGYRRLDAASRIHIDPLQLLTKGSWLVKGQYMVLTRMIETRNSCIHDSFMRQVSQMVQEKEVSPEV